MQSLGKEHFTGGGGHRKKNFQQETVFLLSYYIL